MASVQYLFSLAHGLETELLRKQNVFTKSTKFRTICAILIQKTWRGYFNKKLYNTKRNALITIQSYCRGWLVRKRHNEYILGHEQDMCILNLNRMATKIQAAWRGYITRKLMKMQGRLPKDLLRKREEIQKINEKMRDIMKKQFEEDDNKKKIKEFEEQKQMVLFILFKCHHLLRTQQLEGIYSCHGCKELSIIEQFMKALPLKDYMKELRKTYNRVYTKLQNASPNYMFNSKTGRKLEDMLRLRDKSHDVKEVKPKGYATYNKRFIFSQKVMKIFERDITTLGKYKNPVEFMRSFDKTKNICSKDFVLQPNVDLVDKTVPYHIDLWNQIVCEIHNFPNDN